MLYGIRDEKCTKTTVGIMMKQITISENTYKALLNDSRKRKLSPDEVIEIIIKREYKLK